MKLHFSRPGIALTYLSKPFFNQRTGSLFFVAYFSIFLCLPLIKSIPTAQWVFQCTLVQKNKMLRDKWARFVRTHRANFTPQGRFMVCSEHFGEECFKRSLDVEGSQLPLRPGSIPTIWMKQMSQELCSSRSVRTCKKVSTCFLLF